MSEHFKSIDNGDLTSRTCKKQINYVSLAKISVLSFNLDFFFSFLIAIHVISDRIYVLKNLQTFYSDEYIMTTKILLAEWLGNNNPNVNDL